MEPQPGCGAQGGLLEEATFQDEEENARQSGVQRRTGTACREDGSCKGAKLKTIRVCTKDHCGLLFVAGQRVLRTEAGRTVRAGYRELVQKGGLHPEGQVQRGRPPEKKGVLPCSHLPRTLRLFPDSHQLVSDL